MVRFPATLSTTWNGSAPVRRSIRNEVSVAELSVQARSITVSDAAVAVRPDGAIGGVAAVLSPE